MGVTRAHRDLWREGKALQIRLPGLCLKELGAASRRLRHMEPGQSRERPLLSQAGGQGQR